MEVLDGRVEDSSLEADDRNHQLDLEVLPDAAPHRYRGSVVFAVDQEDTTPRILRLETSELLESQGFPLSALIEEALDDIRVGKIIAHGEDQVDLPLPLLDDIGRDRVERQEAESGEELIANSQRAGVGEIPVALCPNGCGQPRKQEIEHELASHCPHPRRYTESPSGNAHHDGFLSNELRRPSMSGEPLASRTPFLLSQRYVRGRLISRMGPEQTDYDIRLEAAACKLWNSNRGWEILDDTVQIRGGQGCPTWSSVLYQRYK